jgi:hypothetical protein
LEIPLKKSKNFLWDFFFCGLPSGLAVKPMPGAFEAKIHLPYQRRAFCEAVCRPATPALPQARGGTNGTAICSEAVVRLYPAGLPFELRDEHQAEADIVVAVVGAVVVAIRGAAVLRVAVPVAAAQHPVRTHDCCPF